MDTQKCDLDKVREFHEKHGFPNDQHVLGEEDYSKALVEYGDGALVSAGMLTMAARTAELDGDHRMYRAHLMMEELGELIVALGSKDEKEIADALGDLLYVVHGTAATYGFDSHALFDEVHRSNMTKKVRNMHDPRMRDKGKDFTPPDFTKMLCERKERLDEAV